MLKAMFSDILKIALVCNILLSGTINLNADVASTSTAMATSGPDRNGLQKFIEDELKCTEIKTEYLIAMAPMGLVNSATTMTFGAQGIARALTESKISTLYMCGKNVITFKGLWISWLVLYNIRDNITSDDAVALTAKKILLGLIIIGIAAALIFLITNGLIARTLISNADVCLHEENHPFPYTTEQITRLLILGNEEVTPENIEDKREKICATYNNKIFWLANGECTQDYNNPICAENVRGYSRILYLQTPKACPCIMNIQNGLTHMPDFKKDSDGNLILDEEGKPQLTMDAAEYRGRFLRNARVLGAKSAKFQSPDSRQGVIDASCYAGNGASKRMFSISGKVVQCVYNTARNIFEKPIFGSMTSSAGYYVSKNNYDQDLLFVDKKQSEISQILGTKLTYNELAANEQSSVLQKITELMNGYAVNPCYQCGANSNVISNKSTMLIKYDQSVCNATMACCETNGNQYSSSLLSECYINKIESSFSNTGYSSILLLNQIAGQGANLSIKDLLDDFRTNIVDKKNQEIKIQNLYSLNTPEESVALTYTMFDKFNNQIKFLAIILIILWIFLIGLKILFQDMSLGMAAIQKIAINFAIMYFLVFGTMWQDFLFRSILNISQGIGIFAMDTLVLNNPLKDKVCQYGFYIKDATREDIVVGGKNLYKLTCKNSIDATYSLNCYKYDNYKNCIVGDCKIQNPYIPRLEYEEPLFPVEYYDTVSQAWAPINMYCSNVDGADGSLAKRILNKSVGYEVWYCPDVNKQLEEGYRVSELKKLGLLKNILNTNEVYKTAIKSTDRVGRIYELPIIKSTDTKELSKRFANRYNIEVERAKVNRSRPYEKIKIGQVVRDNSYMQFFDRIDCQVFRYLSLGFGGLKNPQDLDFDTSDIAGGLMSSIKYIFFAFPLGLIICLIMIFIAFSLLMIVLKSIQSYAIGIFGLVFYIYISPIFFAIGLFREKARDIIIGEIKKYAISAPLSFFSIGLYTTVIDLAVFGNPARYGELFASDGSILDNCYANSPNDAPTACLAAKIGGQVNMSNAIQNIVIILALTIAGSFFGSGTLGFALGAATSTTVSVSQNISLILPFILKLVFTTVVILTGSMFLDQFDAMIRSTLGGEEMKGGPLDGKFSDISGGNMITGGIKSGAGAIGGLGQKLIGKITG